MEFCVLKLWIGRWNEEKVLFYQNVKLRLDRKKYDAKYEHERCWFIFFGVFLHNEYRKAHK